MDCNISNLQELGAKWEADLHPDQKVYLLALRTTVLLQLLLLTKKRKEEADRTAINCLCRATKRAKNALLAARDINSVAKFACIVDIHGRLLQSTYKAEPDVEELGDIIHETIQIQ